MKLNLFNESGTLLTDADVEVHPKIVAMKLVEYSRYLPLDDLDAGASNEGVLNFRFEEGKWLYNLATPSLQAGMKYQVTVEMPDGRQFITGFALK